MPGGKCQFIINLKVVHNTCHTLFFPSGLAGSRCVYIALFHRQAGRKYFLDSAVLVGKVIQNLVKYDISWTFKGLGMRLRLHLPTACRGKGNHGVGQTSRILSENNPRGLTDAF